MIKIQDVIEQNGIYEIGRYYFWLTEDGQIGNFAFYTQEDEAKKDLDEYFEKLNTSYTGYWAERCQE